MGNLMTQEGKSEEVSQTSKQAESTTNFDIEFKKETSSDDILCDLESHRCFKLKHHSRHISLSNLAMDSLPENLRTDKMLNFIKWSSSVVVRVCVSGISESRQGEFKYAFLFPKSRHLRRYGTGWACLPFENDETSIRIITARHVIYDDWEAVNTEVTFFYDGPNESRTAVAKGKKLYIDNDKRDFVVLECDTSDERLKNRLSDALLQLRNARLSCDSFLDKAENGKEDITALIISHPHGGSKHLAFGSCVDIEEFDTEFDMATGEKSVSKCVYKYDTVTCPGSSGAPVIILGKPGVSYFWTPHCSTNKDGYGVSANGLVIWRSPENEDLSII